MAPITAPVFASFEVRISPGIECMSSMVKPPTVRVNVQYERKLSASHCLYQDTYLVAIILERYLLSNEIRLNLQHR